MVKERPPLLGGGDLCPEQWPNRPPPRSARRKRTRTGQWKDSECRGPVGGEKAKRGSAAIGAHVHDGVMGDLRQNVAADAAIEQERQPTIREPDMAKPARLRASGAPPCSCFGKKDLVWFQRRNASQLTHR